MTLRDYLKTKNNMEFVNKLSLNYNNKNWFNDNKNSLGEISPREFSTEDSTNDKNGHYNISKLEETCILSNKITENFSEIPIYWYDQNVNPKYRTTIVVLEIITDILSKRFPLFKTQIHNLLINELNISEIKEESLEERTKLSYEELLELYQKEHQKVQELEYKNKNTSYGKFEIKFNELYNKDKNFTNEIKRFIYETIPEYVINYSENSKINTSKLYQDKFRCTSSIDLGNIGENYVKDLLKELENQI